MEKFILNEGFILSEKFILNEADESEFAIKSAEDATQNAQLTNWKERFEATSNRSEYNDVLMDYAEKTFGAEHVDDIMEIEDVFRIELDYFGYTAQENPFIDFLKTCFKKGIKFTDKTYGVVHNAYTHNHINKTDYADIYTETDMPILYDKNLYQHSGSEIEKYLKAWDDYDNKLTNPNKKENLADLNKLFYGNKEGTGNLKNLSLIERELANKVGNRKEVYSLAALKDKVTLKTPEDTQKFMLYLIMNVIKAEDDSLIQKYNLTKVTNDPAYIFDTNKALKNMTMTEENGKHALEALAAGIK